MKFPIAFFCFFCIWLSGCNRIADDPFYHSAEEPVDSFNVALYNNGSRAWGFDILKNGRLYIHQPFIPTFAGFTAFPDSASAFAVACTIAERLRKQNFRFLILQEEVKRVLPASAALTPMHQVNPGLKNEVQELIDSRNNGSFIPGDLPDLPDPPVRSRWASHGIIPFGGRGNIIGFSIGTRVFIGGGEVKDQATKDLWSYDTEAKAWTSMADLPGVARTHANGFSTLGKGYFGLGQKRFQGEKNRFLRDFYEYDPSANSWKKLKDFPSLDRVDAVAFGTDRKGYVGLGFAEEYRKDIYEFNPQTGEWMKLHDFLGGPISAATGMGIGTSGYIIGGDRPEGNQKFFYRYSPADKSWEKLNDFPGNPRYYLSSFRITDELGLAGAGTAEGGERRFSDFYLYNNQDDSWNKTPDYPGSVNGVVGLNGGAVAGVLYAGAGYNGLFRDDWNAFEHYFSVRENAGVYDEGSCYPMKYEGTWQLYEECTEERCFAGVQILTNEDLGDFCYLSDVKYDRIPERITIDSLNLLVNKFPREFRTGTSKKAVNGVKFRMFFRLTEITDVLSSRKQSGSPDDVRDVVIVQRFLKAQRAGENISVVHKPDWYRYGAVGDVLVAEIKIKELDGVFQPGLVENTR